MTQHRSVLGNTIPAHARLGRMQVWNLHRIEVLTFKICPVGIISLGQKRHSKVRSSCPKVKLPASLLFGITTSGKEIIQSSTLIGGKRHQVVEDGLEDEKVPF